MLETSTTLYPKLFNNKVEYIYISSIYYVLNIDYNLLLIVILKDKGCYVSIKDERFNVIDLKDNKVVLLGTRIRISYLLNLKYVRTP